MIKLHLRFLAAALAAIMFGAFAASAQTTPPQPINAERQVMVMLDLGAAHYRGGSDYGGKYGSAVAEQARARLALAIARKHGLKTVESWPMDLIGVDCVIMSYSDSRSVEQVVAEVSKARGVAWAQPVNRYEVQGSSAPAKPKYNDPLYPAQPRLRGWDLVKIHHLSTGKGVTIGVIDSRIDARHADLTGQITTLREFTSRGTKAAEIHGTRVAGIIGAKAGNARGMVGVAPGAKMIGLRACWEEPGSSPAVCDSLSLAKALVFAVENNLNVVNMSLSGPRDRLLQTLVAKALNRGTIIVAAVDRNKPEMSFPAMLPGVIAVGDERLSANRTDVYIAPGFNVPTTEPNEKWNLVSGSSYAAAYMSGLAALVLEVQRSQSGRPRSAWLGRGGIVSACAAIVRVSVRARADCTGS